MKTPLVKKFGFQFNRIVTNARYPRLLADLAALIQELT